MSCSAVFQERPYCRGAHQERASESGFQREAQEDILKRVQEIFRDRLGIDDKRVFQKVWGQAEHKFHWTVKDPLTEEAKTRIEEALRGVLVYRTRNHKLNNFLHAIKRTSKLMNNH